MNLRFRPKKRLVREHPEPLAVPDAISEVWSMDFMHDQLSDGRSFRLFNVLDDFNREGLAAGYRMARQAEGDPLRQGPRIHQWRTAGLGRTQCIRIEYIQPGKPQQNAYVEVYNRTVRYAWLARTQFDSIEQVQDKTTRWRWTYNH